MSRVLTLHPPAKINLTLRVATRRDDGYHDVRTLLQSIALSDTLTIHGPAAARSLVDTRIPDVPADRTNLVWRAGRASCGARLGRARRSRATRTCGSRRRFRPRPGWVVAAPMQRRARRPQHALGSPAASTRAGAVGAELGADVPFFLQGGTALGAGRGDELYPVDDVCRLRRRRHQAVVWRVDGRRLPLAR